MNTTEDEQTRERRERAEQDARRKAVADEYDADQARARERLEAAAHVESRPLVGTCQALRAKYAGNDRVTFELFSDNGGSNHEWSVDGTFVYRTCPVLDRTADAIAALDAALSAPAPQLTRTEAIKARYAGNDLVTFGFSYGQDAAAFVDGARAAAWDPSVDEYAPAHNTAEAIIARIDAALAKMTPAQVDDDHTERRVKEWFAKFPDETVEQTAHACRTSVEHVTSILLGDGAAPDEVTPARAMEAATTVFDGKMFVHEPSRIERARKSVEELVVPGMTTIVDLALDEFAEAVAEAVRVMAVDEGSRLRRNQSLALDATTQLRRVHAELGRLIETMDVLLKESA